jgi:lipoyl(octanoyl) transferase
MVATKSTCRLLHDPPGSGAWNMAVDEVLLESAIQHGVMTLRFYRWSEPTLSLGYFQKYADREQHPKSLACPVVRRSTGGGAIIHDQELTYSLAVPVDLPMVKDSLALYDAAHESLVDAMASWGMRARRHQVGAAGGCGVETRTAVSRQEPFLCFERRACGDVLIGSAKVCGSAQRRSRGAILQHGSVLLGMSGAATELPGIRELTGVTMHENELFSAWKPRLAERLGIRAIPGELGLEELASARSLTISKQSADEWVRRR